MNLGETKKALVSIESALKLIEKLRQATLDFRMRVNFFATVQPFYEHYISVLMKMDESAPNKGFNKKALEISEQARARGLLDQLERGAFIRRNPSNFKILEREQILRDKLTDLLVAQESDKTKQITDEFQNISAQFAEVEAEINRQFYSSETVSLPTLKTEEIQNNLDENTVLLEYSLSEKESFLWLVSKTEVRSYKLAPSGEIEKKARQAYDCISRPVPLDKEVICRQENEKLSVALLNPISAQIKDNRLIVVKHGVLNYIPFTFLLNLTKQKYLIETNEIVSLSSASVLSFVRDSSTRNIPNKTLAVFADAVYSLSDGRIRTKPSSSIKSKNKNLPRLFASGLEADRIASLVSPGNKLIKKDFEANRDNFVNSDLENYRILHFATHTFINDEQPELSSIALSFYDSEGKELPGLLRPTDIFRLNLNADLVVLSACQSGLGKQVKGEGIVSLGQNFFSAGAHRLIISLWTVDDKVTAELMSKFYLEYLMEGKNISASMRSAQLKILQDKRWKSPFYWAAFSLEGDW